MAVIFDTSTVRPEERADRLRVAMAETSASSVALLGDGGSVDARLDVWQLGESYLFRAESSPVRMSRSSQQARRDPVPLLALAVQERGMGLHRQFEPLNRVRPGALMGMDMTEAFEFSWLGQGASQALMMPLEQLDVPSGLLRDALPRLTHSPLYDLMTTHVVELFKAADALSAHPLAAEVASSSIDLVRGLVASLSPEGALRREVAAQTLWVRVREYVRQHLRDPGLTAASIAAAHNISVRKLYSVCAGVDCSSSGPHSHDPWRRLSWAFGCRPDAPCWPRDRRCRSAPSPTTAVLQTRRTSVAASGSPTACRRHSIGMSYAMPRSRGLRFGSRRNDSPRHVGVGR